ncbi:nucleotidyltransferase [Spirochaetia bacterium]|nr:nucleotidyltransferase [Spirochaetia bacterium]GHU54971.1 nucleotidyltransferase [Spirochaetia bacterium]
MIDYDKFEKSLKHLELQYQNYISLDNRAELSELDMEAVAESVIQRFEICYDCLWKVLKRYLGEDLGIPELPNSPKPLFRIAFENQLFPMVDPWLLYADARVNTSHDYSEDKAHETLELAGSFLNDAAALYQKMTGKLWT